MPQRTRPNVPIRPPVETTIPLRFQQPESGKFHQYRGAALLILGALTLWLNATFIVPVVMGGIFAICLYPLMGKMARWKAGRVWKAAVVTLLFAFAFLFPLGCIIYFGAGAALTKIQQLQQFGFSGFQLSPNAIISAFRLRPLVDYIESVSPLNDAQVRKALGEVMMTAGTWGVGVLQKLMAGLPGAMFSTIIILLTIFFLLIDGTRAVLFLKQNSVFGPRQTEKLFHNVTALCYSTVVASIAAGAVQSFLILFSCLVTGTEGALLISLVAFLLSFLPMIGTAPVTIFLTAQAFIRGEPIDGFIFLAFVAIVGISDNFVRPYVLKGGASLHPLVGFVAAFGALDMIGFYGVFIGPVVAGLFFALLPIVTRTYARSQKPS